MHDTYRQPLVRLRRQIKRCQGCDFAGQLRLYPEIPTGCQVLVVTDNPGYEGIVERRGLGGLPRRVWDLLAAHLGLGQVSIGFTSVVGCHTAGVAPSESQIKACAGHFASAVELAAPMAIVLLGEHLLDILPLQRRGVPRSTFLTSLDTGIAYADSSSKIIPVVNVPELMALIEGHEYVEGGISPTSPLGRFVAGIHRVRKLVGGNLGDEAGEAVVANAFEAAFCPWPEPLLPSLPPELDIWPDDRGQRAAVTKRRARWRADQLGLEVGDLEALRKIFIEALASADVGCRVKRDPTEKEWDTRKGWRPPLDLVARHLGREIVLSAFFGSGLTETRVAQLDVDQHGQVQRALFPATVKALRKLFPKSLFVRSSSSNGLHVFLFFRSPQAVKKLRTLLELRLARHDLLERRIAPGVTTKICEVLVGVGGRLPLGANSWPLAEGFGADSTPAEMVRHLAAFLDDKRNLLRLEDAVGAELRQIRRRGTTAERWLRELKRKHQTSIARHKLEQLIADDPHRQWFTDSAEAVLRAYAVGIETFGTRQRTTWMLAAHLVRQGCEPDRAVEVLTRWLRSRRHLSRDWRRVPEDVLEELPAILRSVGRGRRYPKGRRGPSLAELRWMIEATGGAPRSERYKLLWFGFRMMGFIRRYGKPTRVRSIFHFPRAQRTEIKCLAAPVSAQLMREWGGGRYSGPLQFWTRKGLLRKVAGHVPGQRANVWAVLIEREGHRMIDLDLGLAQLLNAEEIIAMFPVRVAARINARSVSGPEHDDIA